MHLLFNALTLLVLFILSGFFSGSETALFSLSKLDKRRLAEKYPRMTHWVNQQIEHPRRTLLTILIGNHGVNTLATAVATLMTLEFLGKQWLSAALSLFTLFLILFCEIFPKIIAVRKNIFISVLIAPPLRIFSIILYPVRRVLRLATDWILKVIIPDKREHPDKISEEELKTLVKIGEEEGVLDRDERRMLQKLLMLGERPVKDIMTPRIDLAALNIADPAAKHIEMFRRYHFSQFPVYQNTTDNILGVVAVQDYMLSADQNLQALLKQPLFVPETKRIDDLLSDFLKKDQSHAVCVDEYGGTAGIVTLEDILEEIFGEFYDEYAKPENPVRPYGRNEHLVEAKISLADFNEYFSTHLESEESATLAGFILEKMGEVPEKGKLLDLRECEFRINDVIRNRIKSVIVRMKT